MVYLPDVAHLSLIHSKQRNSFSADLLLPSDLRRLLSYLNSMSPEDSLSLHGDVSRMDLVSWTFGNTDNNQDKRIYIDPDDPQRSLSASEARVMVRKLVAGFIAKGLQPGDCVCVHAFNDVSGRLH